MAVKPPKMKKGQRINKPTLHSRPPQGPFTYPFFNYPAMPLELHRLKMQLANLRIVLEDAVIANKSFVEQTRISNQIEEVERLIEKRTEYLKKLEGTK